MGPKEIVGTVFVFVSIILLVLGYLIGTRKQLNLIAGLDTAQVSNPDGLAQTVGSGLLIFGVVDLVIGLLALALTVQTRWFIAALVIINVVGAVVLFIRARPFWSQAQ